MPNKMKQADGYQLWITSLSNGKIQCCNGTKHRIIAYTL